MGVISVSIDEETLDLFDAIREKFEHPSRSEAIRDAINMFIADRQKWETLEGTGTFILTCAYTDKGDVNDEVSDLVDQFDRVVKSTLQYKDHGRTYVVVITAGEVSTIKELYFALTTTKDVDYSHYQRVN